MVIQYIEKITAFLQSCPDRMAAGLIWNSLGAERFARCGCFPEKTLADGRFERRWFCYKRKHGWILEGLVFQWCLKLFKRYKLAVAKWCVVFKTLYSSSICHKKPSLSNRDFFMAEINCQLGSISQFVKQKSESEFSRAKSADFWGKRANKWVYGF